MRNPFFIFKKAKNVLDPDREFMEALMGAGTLSGAKVTPEAVMGLPTVYACISLLSRVMSTLPLKLYQLKTAGDDEKRIEAVKHPVHNLISTKPNMEMTAADFRGAMMANLALRGNAYARIVRNNSGAPAELWPIHAGRVTPYRDDGGALRYKIMSWQATNTTKDTVQDVPFYDMIHIRGLTFDGLLGSNLMTSAKQSLALAITLDDNASRFFGNQSRPGLILETPTVLKEQTLEALLKQFEAMYGGSANAYKTMILSGMKVAASRAPNDQAQFDESRNRQAVEVCKLFGVPPHKVGILDRATFSNIEQQQIQFVVDTIGPLCVQWEQALAGALLSVDDRRSGYFVKHNLNALQRGDMASRYAAYAVARQWGFASVNDIRHLEDQDGIGPDGDVYLQPMNMVPAGTEATPKAPAVPPINRLNGHTNGHNLILQ